MWAWQREQRSDYELAPDSGKMLQAGSIQDPAKPWGGWAGALQCPLLVPLGLLERVPWGFFSLIPPGSWEDGQGAHGCRDGERLCRREREMDSS